MTQTFSRTAIASDEIVALDLRAEVDGYPLSLRPPAAYRVIIYQDDGTPCVEVAYALRLESEGRTGIAWGADATWADAMQDIDADLDCWLNDPETWEARN